VTGVHAAAIAVVTVGQVGTWIGPLLVGMLAGALDASATGPDAWRDRVAVAGYYASFVSFVQLLGLAAWEQRAFGDYNWRVTGAVFSLIFHGALLLAMFGGLIGPTRPLAVSLAARVKFGGTESATAKINQTLMGWTAGDTSQANTAPA
jgi:hypothetical protein